MGSFATLVETATGPVSADDQEALVTMGAVVGGWGALIVLFAVVSTVGITVTQRDAEIGLLRTIGATPRQARRLVRAETFLVAAGRGQPSVPRSPWLGGRGLLALLRHGGLVSDSVEYGGTAVSPGATAVLVVLVSLLAAGIAGRRATRGPATVTPGEVLADDDRPALVAGRRRRAADRLRRGHGRRDGHRHRPRRRPVRRDADLRLVLDPGRPRAGRARAVAAAPALDRWPGRPSAARAPPATSRRTTPAGGRTCSPECSRRSSC